MGRPARDISGHRFGRLLVLKRAPASSTKSAYWFCRCDCGRKISARSGHLTRGDIQSCGCLQLETSRDTLAANRMKHGMASTPEYKAWQAMKSRCTNPKNTAFPYYGGRGIKVCAAWLTDVTAFWADMGRKPSPSHSLDRIDPDGDYEPGNCRWSDKPQQANNTRRTRYVTYRGRKMPISDAARLAGVVSPKVALERIRNGWNAREAVERPLADWATS
jgi:hypothetical protein